ncbi:MAG TPA: hypothetical protein VEZ17_17830 [Chitinophagaceae bacterium]|nr:hypothetical protein [Chitinophagaceae bacterium]
MVKRTICLEIGIEFNPDTRRPAAGFCGDDNGAILRMEAIECSSSSLFSFV